MNLELISLVLISIGVGALSQFSYWVFVNKERVKELREKIKAYGEKLKSIQRESAEFTKIYSEYLALNAELLKENMKPTLYTFAPFLILFFVLQYYFTYVPINYGQHLLLLNSTPFSSSCQVQAMQGRYYINVSNCSISTKSGTIYISDIINKIQPVKQYGVEIIPQELGIKSPFGFINWFWIYLIITFVTSMILSFIFERIF